MIFVSHDRQLVEQVATKTVELTANGSYVTIGGYQAHLKAQAERHRKAERDEATRLTLARVSMAKRGARARRRKPKSRLAIARKLFVSMRRMMRAPLRWTHSVNNV